MAEKVYIDSFIYKDANGERDDKEYMFEVSADHVKATYDIQVDSGETDSNGNIIYNTITKTYPLSEMVKNYQSFSENVNMVAYGSKEPTNPRRFPLWVKTN